mmetsp:Transcript_40475/g.115377  ORF Transcript_40475/g.115377 Transcript_40475/m.115377 type:complete len:211 (+) Transcript_40475:129-761(+)
MRIQSARPVWQRQHREPVLPSAHRELRHLLPTPLTLLPLSPAQHSQFTPAAQAAHERHRQEGKGGGHAPGGTHDGPGGCVLEPLAVPDIRRTSTCMRDGSQWRAGQRRHQVPREAHRGPDAWLPISPSRPAVGRRHEELRPPGPRQRQRPSAPVDLSPTHRTFHQPSSQGRHVAAQAARCLQPDGEPPAALKQGGGGVASCGVCASVCEV